jgi:hypothetical protein
MARYMAGHPRARFALFLIFMLAVCGFGVWELAKTISDHHSLVKWVVLETVISAALIIPLLAFVLPKKRSNSWQFQLPILVIVALLFVAIPSWRGWYAAFPFASKPWTQVPGDVVLMCFPVFAVVIRTRQKFWRRDWSIT